MDAKNIEELKRFVEQCKESPSVIYLPSLQFFKDFLQSLGARIQSSSDSSDYEDEKKPIVKRPCTSRNNESDDDIVKSDVLEPENDPPQKMGDPITEITEENYEAAQSSKIDSHKQADAATVLQEGEVIGVNSASTLKTNLDAASKASRLAIVYFTATWCGPCRYISPEYTSFAKKYPKVVFLKADIDEAVDAAMEWNISSIPTFFFVKDGRGIEQLVSTDKNVLEKKIIQHAG